MNSLARLNTRSRIRLVLRLIALAALIAGISMLIPAPVPASGASTLPILFVGESGRVLRYDVTTGALIDVFITLPAPYREPYAMAIGPDHNLYILANQAGDSGGQVRRYDLTSGALIDIVVDLKANGFAYPTGMAFGPDGNLYVGGQHSMNNDLSSAIVRFNGATGALIDTFIPQLASGYISLLSMIFGLDGNLYVGSTNSIAAQVERYDGATGASLGTFIPDAAAFDLVFGPDGNFYTVHNNGVTRYNGTTGAFIDSFAAAQGGWRLAFGPDGNLYVLTQGQRQVSRYDGVTGAFIDLFVPPDPFAYGTSLLFYGSAQPPARPPAKRVYPAAITVAQQTEPNRQARPGDIITSTIVATNRGTGRASDVTITMPFDPALLRVIDAHLSRPDAWVSDLRADALDIRTGPLAAGGDTVTATVRLEVQPGAAAGAPLGTRLNYTWKNDEAPGGGSGSSNLPPLAVGPDYPGAPWLSLAVTPAQGSAGTTFVFSGGNFAPGEPVALWYNRPGLDPAALEQHTAGADGTLHLELSSADLPPGWYALVAHGLWSGITAVAPFQIQ